MLCRIEQLLMLVLAMQLDEPVRKILERRRGRERAVDERAASALRGDLASNDQLAAVFGLEDRFDGGEIFAGANEILSRASAEQEPDGFDEDGFASAGFASQDVERLFKVDGHRLDDREVADGQVANHGECLRRNPGERNSHRIIALTEFPMACYGCTIRRSPSSASPWK